MSEVVWLINCTLDGRCGHEDVVADDDLHRHATETLWGADVVVFGRKTFELLEPHWSEIAREQSGTSAENEFARTIDPLPKVVFSHSLAAAGWNGRIVNTDAADEVRRLRGEGCRVVLQASPALAASLRARGLIDRCRFLLQPLVAGGGPTLFSPQESMSVTLDRVSSHASGTVALDYSMGDA